MSARRRPRAPIMRNLAPHTPKIINFATDVEQGTLDQAEKLAAMPFVFPHVALMPDAHVGLGSAVGTVFGTVDAVIPSAVGVDIGCFVGETRVPLLDGRQKTLRQMTEEGGIHWVYSLDKDRNIVAGRATALKTRTHAELMSVTVSGGEDIVCTPDHQFMLNDGTYREARDLKFNDSLMPLYRQWQTRGGYESASTGKGSSRQTHIMIYEAFNGPLPEGHVVHHENDIHFDNRPENLVAMESGEHSRYHRSGGHSFNNYSTAFQELRLAGIKRRTEGPEKRQKMAEVGTAEIVTYMESNPEHFKESVADSRKHGAPYLTKFNTSPRSCDECGEVAKNPAALRWHKVRKHSSNHEVIGIEYLERREDVYCLQVENHNNFALAAGVFVHNCGMIGVRTGFTAADITGRDLRGLRDTLEANIPLSPGNYNDWALAGTSADTRTRELAELAEVSGVDLSHSPKWRQQLGSLGGGNHFIELCLDEDESVWMFLHSGSRGVGNKIARKHIAEAQAQCEKYWIPLPDADLAYLVADTPEFDSYLADLTWAQRFAWLNREEMMDRFATALSEFVGAEVEELERVNCHHNYTVEEQHYGRRVWVTRKGAVRAEEGDTALIPGSMGTASYVVEGKGHAAALNSAPHGAGRRLSRTQAKEQFTTADLERRMKGIVYRPGKAWVDEIPDAYKDIDQVMVDAEPLVTVRHRLRQVLNVKGV